MHDITYLNPQAEAGPATAAEIKARLEHAGLLRRNPARMEVVPRFISVKEAADAFGVSPGTINNLINENRLPAVQFGGKGSRVQIPVRAINLIIDLAMILGGQVTLHNWHEVLDDLVAREIISARDMASLMGDATAHTVASGPVRPLNMVEAVA